MLNLLVFAITDLGTVGYASFLVGSTCQSRQLRNSAYLIDV